MLRQMLLAAVCVIAIAFDVDAEPAPFTARVKVEVSSIEGDLQAIVRSRLNARLRALPGVIVTPDAPTFIVSVTAVELKSQGGASMGYVLSVSIARPLNWDDVRGVLTSPRLFPDAKITDTQLDMARALFVDYIAVLTTWVRPTPPDNLEKLCDSLVAEFDVVYLEADRQKHQRSHEALKSEGRPVE